MDKTFDTRRYLGAVCHVAYSLQPLAHVHNRRREFFGFQVKEKTRSVSGELLSFRTTGTARAIMHAFTIFLSSFASLCGAAILARPVVPKPPSVPKPVVPKPVVPIPRPLEPIVPGSGQQPDVVVRSNIQHLEDRLKRVGDGIDFGVELVDAILGDEATTMTMSGNPGSALGMLWLLP